MKNEWSISSMDKVIYISIAIDLASSRLKDHAIFKDIIFTSLGGIEQLPII